jgi:hypothetical protein
VTGLLQSLGHKDVLDLGGIETARGTAMLLPIRLRLMSTLGTPRFTFKTVADGSIRAAARKPGGGEPAPP